MEKQIEIVINRVVKKYPAILSEDLKQECWLVALPKMKSYESSNGSLFRFLKNRLNRSCREFINNEINMQHENLTKALNVIDPTTI